MSLNSTTTFPALSIRQPWADLILWGIKDVENRRWESRFRGLLLVHAGAKVDRHGIAGLEEWYGIVLPADYKPRTRAILGMVEMIDCVRSSPSPFFGGPLGFVLRNPIEFRRPVAFPGRLGVFQVPGSVMLDTPEVQAATRPSNRPSA